MSIKNKFSKKNIFLLVFLLVFTQCSSIIEHRREVNTPVINREALKNLSNKFKEYEYYVNLIPVKYRQYLIDLSIELDIPINIIARVPILESGYRENVSYKNRNGSIDRGIIQINSDCQSWYIKTFWKEDHEFDVWNWKDNFRLGFSEIRWAYDVTGSWEKSVMAFNCGIGNVGRGTIPKSTIKYKDFIFKEIE